MPKTAIDEDSQTALSKKEVRIAENFLMPAPAGYAVLPEQFYQNDFCGLVATAPDTGHNFGSFGLRENVAWHQRRF